MTTKDQLPEVLEKHRKWLRGEADGDRANLSGANLSREETRAREEGERNRRVEP